MDAPASPVASPATQAADDQQVEALLAQMANGARKFAVEKIGSGSAPSHRPPKVRYTHEAMARLILENPWIHQNQIAAHFGHSAGWVSTIITSDAFQSYYSSLRAELLDPELRVTLEERFRALTTQSLRVLQEKLSAPVDKISDTLVLRAAELGAKSLGIGGNAPPPPPPNPAEYLPALAERLMRLQGHYRQPATDAVIVSGP